MDDALELARERIRSYQITQGKLDLSGLNLTAGDLGELMVDLKNLYGLRELHLDGNRLKEIPEKLGDFKSLEILNLNDNPLRVLGEGLKKLTGLVELGLGNTQLMELPEWIGSLKNLTVLNLGSNHLKELPVG